MDFLGGFMKFKPVYIYSLVIAAALIFLIFSNNNDNEGNKPVVDTNKQMPMDDVHKNLNMPGNQPGKDNVSENYKKQLEMLKRAYEQNPEDTLKIREYADFLSAAHNNSEAITLYKKILTKNPKRTDIYFSIASVYYNQKDFKNSEETISRILKYDRNNFEARYNLGAIAATQGDKEKARLYWQQIIDEMPHSTIGELAKSSMERL